MIVSKRINTRFFTNSPRSPAANPPCGTVVDNTVTYDDRFDFFLISQKVNQGTVSPTNFNVIYNSANLTPDAHQSVAYALTQLYYNWAVIRVSQFVFKSKQLFKIYKSIFRVHFGFLHQCSTPTNWHIWWVSTWAAIYLKKIWLNYLITFKLTQDFFINVHGFHYLTSFDFVTFPYLFKE